MVKITMINPKDLHHPVGPYSQVSEVTASKFIYLAGQTATDMHGNTVGVNDVEAQCAQVFANVEAGLRAAGASWGNVIHFTNYLISHDDMPAFVNYRNRYFPTWFPHGSPPNTLLFIEKLLRKEFRVEVQAIAAI